MQSQFSTLELVKKSRVSIQENTVDNLLEGNRVDDS